ncbi:MAG TPA: BMP family ABC transporter substrate-binding protein, partial [Burkholderiales bacterium]|nr:BMP family ABC transporter substrate-binding protein [Burkholderiales bacterium]
ILTWGGYYTEIAKQVINGTWKTQDIKHGIKEGMIELAPLNAAIPADAAKLFGERKQALTDGKLQLFQGPIKDQSGKIKVEAGKVLPLPDLMAINWYVEGVEGSIPK